ncbi:unnamed protein product [Ectocarpus sp. CCAP 1310/34]|nr:unnamed protein product [Ectocarpus sp. CCAP 1310/34]
MFQSQTIVGAPEHLLAVQKQVK